LAAAAAVAGHSPTTWTPVGPSARAAAAQRGLKFNFVISLRVQRGSCLRVERSPHSPRLSSGWVDLADKQPVVDIAQGIRHVRCGLVVHPFAIHDKFILVIPAAA